jgi:two-component system, NarL family, response regulator LiaR
MCESIRILIAGYHPIMCQGLRAVIDGAPGMELVGEASDGAQAALQARSLQPDVIVMDLVSGICGTQAIHEIVLETPEACILILTACARNDKVIAAIQAGAMGYLLHDVSPRQLLRAIRNVYLGRSSLHPSIARMLISELKQPDAPPDNESLTEREVQVLQLVAQGLSNQEIGEQLMISEWTVATHVSHILEKLHLPNRTKAALYAIREGLVDFEVA